MKSHTPSGRNSLASNRLTKLFRGLLLKSWSGSKNWLCERLCEDAVKLVKSPNLDFIIKCQKEPGSGSTSTCIVYPDSTECTSDPQGRALRVQLTRQLTESTFDYM